MDWEFLKSLLLVAVGAGITYGVDAFRRASDRRKAIDDRNVALSEARRIEGRQHAERLYELLDQLSAKVRGDTFDPDGESVDPPTVLSRQIYATFPLVPDPLIRELVRSGMYGINNPDLLDGLLVDSHYASSNGHRQRQILHTLHMAIAAYLRGDQPDEEDVELLRKVEAHVDSLAGT